MKVKVWFLLRSRQAKLKKLKDNKSEVDFNQGIYLMNRDAINFYSKGGKPKGVETFFLEGNPAPIKIDAQGTDSSIDFLDRFIYENVIEQTGAIPKERFKGAVNFLRNNLSFTGVIRWGMVLLIVGALVGAWLGL